MYSYPYDSRPQCSRIQDHYIYLLNWVSKFYVWNKYLIKQIFCLEHRQIRQDLEHRGEQASSNRHYYLIQKLSTWLFDLIVREYWDKERNVKPSCSIISSHVAVLRWFMRRDFAQYFETFPLIIYFNNVCGTEIFRKSRTWEYKPPLLLIFSC